MPHYDPRCWLAKNGRYERGKMPSCSGEVVKAHLIPQQVIRREASSQGFSDIAIKDFMWDSGAWVWACGGPMARFGFGAGGHHGMFDNSRTIRVPRQQIPRQTVELARFLGIEWWLDRTYRLEWE